MDDICGDLQDLVGVQITQAECVTDSSGDDDDGTNTWTFYKIGTPKGRVTVRWYGSSNGYYSESVTFARIDDDDE